MPSHFERVFEAQHQKAEGYHALLPDTDDLALMTLKGHLVLEELLFDLASTHCRTPAHLEKAKLSFAQLLHVTRSLVSVPIPDEAWQALAMLNAIRNALAHRLQPQDIDKKVDALYQLCLIGLEPLPPEYVRPSLPARVVEECVYSLIGALTVFNGFSKVLAGPEAGGQRSGDA